MHNRKIGKHIRKRLLSFLLATSLVFSNVTTTVLAARENEKKMEKIHYNPEIVERIGKLCSNGENPIQILDDLREKGFIDENGMPLESEFFQVDGVEMTLDELTKEANKRGTGPVNLDGENTTWEAVNSLLSEIKLVTQVQNFVGSNVDINEDNIEEYKENLKSLERYLEGSPNEVYLDPDASTFGSGISHLAKVVVSPNSSNISESGTAQTITVSVSLTTKQKVPVTFSYRTVSATASAGGSGTVTIPAGEESTSFNVTYYGNSEKRNGNRFFYIQCYNIKNALFNQGEASGRNITFPITVTKNDTFSFEHDVWGVESVEPKGYDNADESAMINALVGGSRMVINPFRGSISDHTINYKMIEPYVSIWRDNIYTLTYYASSHYMNSEGKQCTGSLVSAKAIKIPGLNYSQLSDYTKKYSKNIGSTDTIAFPSIRLVATTDSSWSTKTDIVVDEISNDIISTDTKIKLHIKEVHEKANLESLSIPTDTFYSGQSVPITAVFSENLKIDNSIQLKLADGTLLYPKEAGTIGNSCTFLYPVPMMPSGSIPAIKELSFHGTKTCSDDLAVIPEQNNTIFDLTKLSNDKPGVYQTRNERCKLQNYKDSSFTNITCQIDDAKPGTQWVTEVITIDQSQGGAFRSWIESNCQPDSTLDFSKIDNIKNGKKTQEYLKDSAFRAYADEFKYEISEYIKSMYLSVDGGIHKVPFYVVATRGEEYPIALVAHYKPELNIGLTTKQEVNEIFMDPAIDSTTNYLTEDKDAPLLFGVTSRGLTTPQTYPVKNVIFAYPGAAKIDYSTENPFLSNWSNITDDTKNLVSYHLEYDNDIRHAVTGNKENPNYYESKDENTSITYHSTNIKEDEKDKVLLLQQESKEGADDAIATKLYEMENPFQTNIFYVDSDLLSLNAKFETPITFTGTQNLIWISSDESIAAVKYPDKYIKNPESYGEDQTAPIEIIPTGKTGTVYFTLYALNDGIDGFTPVEICKSVTLSCGVGDTPFLKIPSVRGKQTILNVKRNHSLDICFTSNLTEKNAKTLGDKNFIEECEVEDFKTNYEVNVYSVDYAGNPVGEPIYTTNIPSSIENTIGKVTIPEGIFKNVSDDTEMKYLIEISAPLITVEDTSLGEMKHVEKLTANAGVCVAADPPNVSLGKLESYSILDDQELIGTYDFNTNGANIAYTSLSILNSDGTEVYSQALEEGEHTFTWKPDTVGDNLKSIYVVRAVVQAKNGTPITDSYILKVYNKKAIDILVDAVEGKKGPDALDVDEITLDNHEKIKGLLSEDGKTITLNNKDISLVDLMEDINLSAMISINYGQYIWGQLSDQIKWEVIKDDNAHKKNKESEEQESTPTTLNYSQGGAYSNINAYSYVSYAPRSNFMAVGLEDGKTIVKATHARTGMETQISITTNRLEDEFYLFKFVPETKTKVHYTNGHGDKCCVESNENGELALYEPSGIKSDVQLYSVDGANSYVGTIQNKLLATGEQDVSKLDTYPVINYMLRSISNTEIYIMNENGAPYANQTIYIRGGVYKNGEYCYAAGIGREKNAINDGKKDQEFHTDELGRVVIYLDSSQFYNKSEETITERDILPEDKFSYVYEVKFQLDEQIGSKKNIYEPQLVHIDGGYDYGIKLVQNCSKTIRTRPVITGALTPVVNSQCFYQYERESNYLSNTTEVYGFTESIGISYHYPKGVLETETLLWGENVETESFNYKDVKGKEFYYGEQMVPVKNGKYESFYEDLNGIKAQGQKNEMVHYPFMDMPVCLSTWTMEESKIKNWSEEDEHKPLNVSVYKEKSEMKLMSNSFDFCMKKSEDVLMSDNLKDELEQLTTAISSKIDIGTILSQLMHNETILAIGSAGLSTLINKVGLPLDIIVSPTEDPTRFLAMVSVGNPTLKYKETLINKNPCEGDIENGGHYYANHQDNRENQIERLERLNEIAMDDTNCFAHQVGPMTLFFGGQMFFEFCFDGTVNDWKVTVYGGGIKAGAGIGFTWGYRCVLNGFCVDVDISLGAAAVLGFHGGLAQYNEEQANSYLTQLECKIYTEIFLGTGFSLLGADIVFGGVSNLTGYNRIRLLNGWEYDKTDDSLNNKNYVGDQVGLLGMVGFRIKIKMFLFSFAKTFACKQFNIAQKNFGDYEYIQDYWDENVLKHKIISQESISDGLSVCSVSEDSIEDRAYLENFSRSWVGGKEETSSEEGSNYLSYVQKNAYTFAQPIFNRDGSILAYLSDSDSSEVEDTLASFARKENGKYVDCHGIDPITYQTDELDNITNKAIPDGKLDPVYDENGKVINRFRKTDRTGYSDSSLCLDGTNDFSVATWVRQLEGLDKQAGSEVTNEDITRALQGSEVYTSIWNGSDWNTVRLTDNTSGDFSPSIAVNEKYAVVSWRNVSSSNAENPLDFNVRDNINAKIYDKTENKWSETVTLYQGENGKVESINASITSDGTALVAYNIKTSEDDSTSTDTEIMYTVLSPKGEIIETVRATNNDELDQGVQATCVNRDGEEHFILGWYNKKESENFETKEDKIASSQEDVQKNQQFSDDIKLLSVSKNGMPNIDFVESIKMAGASKVAANFAFSKTPLKADLNDLSIIWVEQVKDNDNVEQDNNYILSAMRFHQEGETISLSTPLEIARTENCDAIDSFSTYSDGDELKTVMQTTHYEVDLDNPATYTVENVEIVKDIDANGEKKTETQKIYTPVGEANICTASCKYPLCSIEVAQPDVPQRNVMMGATIPVTFYMKNNGIEPIDKIIIQLDNKQTQFDVSLLPGESTSKFVDYKIPTDEIKDVPYSVVSFNATHVSKAENARGMLILNRPIVSMKDMKLIKEENQSRTVQITLQNASNVPLKNGGKTIEISLYDQNPDTATFDDTQISPVETIEIKDNKSLALIDAGAYQTQITLSKEKLKELIDSTFSKEELKKSKNEIPDDSMKLYGTVSIVGEKGSQSNERTPYNISSVSIQSLITKYKSTTNISTHIEKQENATNVVVNVKNNSYAKKTNGNVLAVLINKKGKIISKMKQTYDEAKDDKGIIKVPCEGKSDIIIRFTEDDLLKGYTLNDGVSAYAYYTNVDESESDSNAKLSRLQIKGQEVAIDEFMEEKRKSIKKVKAKIVEDGNPVQNDLEVKTVNYSLYKTLNEEELYTILSAVPEKIGDSIRVVVNGKEIMNGTGPQIQNISLQNSKNSVQIIVDGNIYSMIEVTRVENVPVKDEVVKNKTKENKVVKKVERYALNKEGNPIDADGRVVDLSGEDVIDSKVIYLKNESIYNVYLEKMNTDVAPSIKADNKNLLILPRADVKGKSVKLTWNKLEQADGYLVYGAKCNTSKKSYSFKRLTLIKNNKTTSYVVKNLELGHTYKYIVKAFKNINGKKEIVSISYILRTYIPTKNATFGNVSEVFVNKESIWIKRNKYFQIKAYGKAKKGVKCKKNLEKLRYVSSDTSIATVTETGLVKGNRLGECYIYVVAQNGIRKKIKVTVKSK